MSRQSQKEAVLRALQGGPKTTLELAFKLGRPIMSVTARVSDLRKEGHHILTTEKWHSGTRTVTYTLQGHAVQLPAMPPAGYSAALQREGLRHCASPHCYELFKPKRKSQKYHSEHCRWDDWNRQHPRLNFEQASTGNPQVLPLRESGAQ